MLIQNIKQAYKDELINYNEITIDEILNASGLPKREELEKICIGELSEIRDKIKCGMFTSMLVDKLDIGLKLNKQMGICGEKYGTLELMNDQKITFPYIYADDIFDDNDQVSIWMDYTDNFVTKMKEFNSICGI